MICYVLAMGKEYLGPHGVVVYGNQIFWPSVFISSPDHLESIRGLIRLSHKDVEMERPTLYVTKFNNMFNPLLRGFLILLILLSYYPFGINKRDEARQRHI